MSTPKLLMYLNIHRLENLHFLHLFKSQTYALPQHKHKVKSDKNVKD